MSLLLIYCCSERFQEGGSQRGFRREAVVLSFLSYGLRQVVGAEWLPGQQSLVELCGPEGLIISCSHLPGRLLNLLPGKQT